MSPEQPTAADSVERLMSGPVRVLPRLWPLTQRLLAAQGALIEERRKVALLSQLLELETQAHARTRRMRDVLLDRVLETGEQPDRRVRRVLLPDRARR